MTKEREYFSLDPNEIPFATDGLSAPTFFADYIRGTMVGSGIVKLNLIENRLDALNSAVRAVHVATIVVPHPQIVAWADFLKGVAEANPWEPDTDATEAPESNG